MARLLIIYSLSAGKSTPFRYAETARRLFNDQVDVRLLTVGKEVVLPSLLQDIPHHHIPTEPKRGNISLSPQVQTQIWKYLMAIPKDGLSIFMNGLDFPLVFWACRKLNLQLTAQFPEEQQPSVFHRRLLQLVCQPKPLYSMEVKRKLSITT